MQWKQKCAVAFNSGTTFGSNPWWWKKNPQIYKVFDFTKGGADIIDQRAQYYTCKVKSNRWIIAAFSYILNNSRINASKILALNKKDDPRKVNLLDFWWELVQNLTTPFIENRSLNGLSSMVQQKMCVILKRKITSRNPSAELFPARNKQRKKCRLCINDPHDTGYKSIKKTFQSIQRNAKSVLNVYAPIISCRFVSIVPQIWQSENSTSLLFEP